MKALASIMLALSALPSIFFPARAEHPSVFPQPKLCEFGRDCSDVDTVQVHKRRGSSHGGMWDKLPAVPGGYALEIEKGRLTAWVNDADGLYYARQTLSQLLQGVPGSDNAQADPFPDKGLEQIARLGKLPQVRIIDWPDLPERGVVEGYYGTPWSTEARESLFRFYGRNKMNLYIYGPKDDAFHHGAGCYQPYPAKKAKEIAHLVKEARRNHVRFVWAIHPANTVDWNREGGKPQLDQLCEKMESLYKLGVRDFGVFVDDSSGEILKPERQAELCNYILEHFIRKHPRDVTQQLIMVPTGYNRSWTNPGFLSTLGSRLDKGTRVMWTGDTVVHDITLEGQRWVHSHLGRPTFIWWNWPCSDFKRGRLSMGRAYGLGTEPEMREEMTGFTANPMEQAEANKVGLFGVADYCWNITAFRSEGSWRAGIRRLYPQCAEAMQAFCDHNSYLLPNGHGYYREESVAMHDTAEGFIASVNAWEPDAALARRMQAEYHRMAEAGRALTSAPGMAALQREIKPWLTAFTHTGEAGEALMASLLAEQKKERLRQFFLAVESLNRMRGLTRMDWNGGRPRAVADVEVASYIMTPALHEAFRYSNSLVYADISGRRPTTLRPTFSTNGGEAARGGEKIADGDVTSFWDSRQMQRAGHWYCLDFGERTPVTSVSLLMGAPRRADDYAAAGQMEYSEDGVEWKPLGGEVQGPAVVLDLSRNPIRARMLRYRITRPRDKWLAIAEFRANSPLPAYATSSVPGFAGMTVSRDATMVGINRIMEAHSARPGDVIELHLPGAVQGTALEIDLGNERMAQWAQVELRLANGKRVRVRGEIRGSLLSVKGKALRGRRIASVRLTHAGREEEPVRLHVFKLALPAADPARDPATLSDADFSTGYDCSRGLSLTLPVPAGATHVFVVGAADCFVNGERGRRSSMMQLYPVEKGVRQLRLHAPAQKGKMVNEVIFRMKP